MLNLKLTTMRNLFMILLISASVTVAAQNAPKVILQLQSSDTLVHKSVFFQISNIKKAFPDAEIELVCHGPGIEFLLKKKSFYVTKLGNQNFKDVTLAACEFTMSQKNIKKDDLVSLATTVPYGIVEILKKQQLDWLYVKLGF
jgi:uncharacterized protein